MLYAGVRQAWPLWPIVLGSLPALLLLLWFGMTWLAALRRRRIAGWLLSLGIVASACVFVYDASTRNYQLHSENFRGGSSHTFLYNTWWWYNESWFRG